MKEKFTLEEAVASFSLDRIVKSGASLALIRPSFNELYS